MARTTTPHGPLPTASLRGRVGRGPAQARYALARALLLLAAILVALSGPVTRARADAALSDGTMVLCIDSHAIEVAVDGEGRPVSPGETPDTCGDCPVCAVSHPAILIVPAVPSLHAAENAFRFAPTATRALAAARRALPRARAPPETTKKL